MSGFHDEHTPLTDDEQAIAERGAALIAAAMGYPEAQAPQALRESLDRARAAGPARRTPLGALRGRILATGGAAAVVVVALVVAFGGSAGDAGSPSVDQIAGVARLPATQGPPPARRQGSRAYLAAQVQGLAFPDWSGRFAWDATGRREDRVGGRAVTTVLYRSPTGATLGYAIVAGAPLAAPRGSATVVAHGEAYRVTKAAGRTTVTWTQSGHTCVIDSPSSVPDSRLVGLASWAAA